MERSQSYFIKTFCECQNYDHTIFSSNQVWPQWLSNVIKATFLVYLSDTFIYELILMKGGGGAIVFFPFFEWVNDT